MANETNNGNKVWWVALLALLGTGLLFLFSKAGEKIVYFITLKNERQPFQGPAVAIIILFFILMPFIYMYDKSVEKYNSSSLSKMFSDISQPIKTAGYNISYPEQSYLIVYPNTDNTDNVFIDPKKLIVYHLYSQYYKNGETRVVLKGNCAVVPANETGTFIFGGDLIQVTGVTNTVKVLSGPFNLFDNIKWTTFNTWQMWMFPPIKINLQAQSNFPAMICVGP